MRAPFESECGRREPSAMRLRVLSLVVALITYGSLYPFKFEQPRDIGAALAGLIADRRTWTSLSDVLGNVGLFVPLGFSGVWWSLERASPLRVAAGTLVGGTLLAFAIQVAQLWVPARAPIMSDVIWNFAGLAIGVAVGLLSRSVPVFKTERSLDGMRSAAVGLVVLWLVAHLAPFVPSLDLGSLKSNLRPLILTPSFRVFDAISVAVQVLLVWRLAAAVVDSRRSIGAVAVLSAIVLGGRLLVVGQSLDLTVAAGVVAGLAICALWQMSSVPRSSPAPLVALVLASYTLQAVLPIELRAVPVAFSWVPFASTLRGTMLTNLRSLAGAAFMLGGCLWLIRAHGRRIWPATVGLAAWSLLLEACQTMIAGRTPSSTEPVVVLLAGFLLAQTNRGVARSPEALLEVPGTVPAESADAREHSSRASRIRFPLAVLAGFVICVVIGLHVILDLPGIPYNVTGLFHDGGSVMALTMFALVLMWMGAGPAILAQGLRNRRHSYAWLPAGVVAVSLVSYVLLSYSATHESFDDVLGTPNIFGLVTQHDIWGGWWRDAFTSWHLERLVIRAERMVRYVGLYSPQVVLLTVMLMVTTVSARTRLRWWQLTALFVVALAWLRVSRTIVVTWAATDNLTELIAREAPLGTDGVPYLLAIPLVLAANVALLVHASSHRRWWPAALLLLVAAVPATWGLLSYGLEGRVEKYGHLFSGVQFLLGPDRARTLTSAALFARWTFVHIGAVAVTFIGAWTATRLLADVSRLPESGSSASRN